MNANPRYLTRAEFQATFAISAATFYRLAGAGKVRISKLGRKTLVSPEEVDRFRSLLAAQEV